MKLYSIIITCYNREKFISKAIRSALNQINISREMLEVIVVDDFSTDSSVEKIQEFIPLIKFIQNKKNFGVAISRNKGIKISKGKYILMLDSDDYISNNFLEIVSCYLDNNYYWDAAACDYLKVDKKGKVIKRFNFRQNPIACGILFRREKIFEIGLYNRTLRLNEEKELRKKFFKKKFKMGYVELPLYRYVIHEGNITRNINDK